MPITYDSIASFTLTTATSIVQFSSISTDYTDLVLILSQIGTNTTHDGNDIIGRFNGDTGSNYANIQMYGNGSAALTDTTGALQWLKIGLASGASMSDSIINIPNYASTSMRKFVLLQRNLPTNYPVVVAGSWDSTAAVNTISLQYPTSSTDFAAGSRFSLYGIKGA